MKPSGKGIVQDWVMLATGVIGFFWELYAGRADPIIIGACLAWAGVPAALAVFQGKLSSTLTRTTDGSLPPPSPPTPSVSSSTSGDSS